MQNGRTIFLLVLAAGLLAAVAGLRGRRDPVAASPTPPASALRESPPEVGPAAFDGTLLYPTNPLYAGDFKPLDSNLVVEGQVPLAERLMAAVDVGRLEKYEGSHSMEELKAMEQGPASYSVSSGWLFGGSNLPQAGLTVSERAEQGGYGVSGGEVFLPSSGMGVSYEKNEETGETKTFLNLKREF